MKKGSNKGRILVVDDDAGVVDFLVEMLSEEGYQTEGESSPRAALERIAATDYDLVVSDVEMPELRGTELMTAIHARRPGQLVLLITAFGSIDLAVQSMRAGACDFITKPFHSELLLLGIERALRERQMYKEIIRLRDTLAESDTGDLIVRSPSMKRVVELARRAARTTAAVLMTGESGVGKGHIARFIHALSDRRERPFVQVNCAALPATLVESELFGVRKGAYTDARDDRPGLFLQASGGTLFLDEIGEMPMESQPKLLQALESSTVRPVGSAKEVAVDVRVIAATNRPIEEATRNQTFRSDLYYRLNVIRIEIPPLRERPEDIEPLIDQYLNRACRKLNLPIVGISAEAMRWLLAYQWPGNVRELANQIERAVALAEHDTILLPDLRLVSEMGEPPFLNMAAAVGSSLADVERAYIRKVMQATNGNKARAARVLGIDRRTLYRKLGEEEPEVE